MKLELIKAISRHVELSAEEQRQVIHAFSSVKLKRKDLWLKEGGQARSLAFVVSGCLYSYSLDNKDQINPLQFARPHGWITDLYAYLSDAPSTLSVEALTSSEILSISRSEQLKLFEAVPKLERYFRIITENALVSSRKRNLDLLNLSAKERYEQFITKYPGLLQEVPLKLIAKYIGITPEFLSKLRREH
ncbi:MAG: Crp/Fnr family transcriptional regulator [Flavobacteriaceae bacterium]